MVFYYILAVLICMPDYFVSIVKNQNDPIGEIFNYISFENDVPEHLELICRQCFEIRMNSPTTLQKRIMHHCNNKNHLTQHWNNDQLNMQIIIMLMMNKYH